MFRSRERHERDLKRVARGQGLQAAGQGYNLFYCKRLEFNRVLPAGMPPTEPA